MMKKMKKTIIFLILIITLLLSACALTDKIKEEYNLITGKTEKVQEKEYDSKTETQIKKRIEKKIVLQTFKIFHGVSVAFELLLKFKSFTNFFKSWRTLA